MRQWMLIGPLEASISEILIKIQDFSFTKMHLKISSARKGGVNSLAPGICQFNFRKVICKLNLVNGGWGISYEIALRWMPQYLTDDKSTLVKVMAWCRQATSHYLSQCWPRSMSPYGVIRPQWVNISWHWNHRVVMMPTLLSLATWEVSITTSGAASRDISQF